MKYIVYLSTAVDGLTDHQLLNILAVSRKYNFEHGITGILLYSKHTFIQLLEGDADEIDRIFNKICRDPRHKGIIKLFGKPLIKRNFSDWAMGFALINTEEADEIIGYLQSLDNLLSLDSNHRAVLLLKSFVKTNRMAVNY